MTPTCDTNQHTKELFKVESNLSFNKRIILNRGTEMMRRGNSDSQLSLNFSALQVIYFSMITNMVQKCSEEDFKEICSIINDGASAYKGIIPADRWHEPYMPEEELQTQMNEGVRFWRYKEGGEISGVMGIQYKGDVTLIRHAYVRTANRSKGIGGKLLSHLASISSTPVLIGTWAAATWAIQFYQKHGFRLVSEAEKERLLRKYWSIPERQIETSVVLAGKDWTDREC